MFSMTWRVVDEGEWERARISLAAGSSDSQDEPDDPSIEDLVVGCLQLKFNGVELFPRVLFERAMHRDLEWRRKVGLPEVPIVWTPGCDGLKLSLADFAGQLADNIDATSRWPIDHWKIVFLDPEGGVSLETRRRDGVIEVRSTMGESPVLSVPLDAFLDGCRRFLLEFADEANRQIPGILTWNVFAGLRQYAS